MGKLRRGNYIFVSWIGDHGDHIHVYKDGKLIVKWDFEENKAMKGRASRKLLRLILKLRKDGEI